MFGLRNHRIAAESGGMLAQTESRNALWRTLQAFNVTRIVVAVLLLIYVSLNQIQAAGSESSIHYLQLCSVYLLAALSFLVLTAMSRERFLLQLSTQIAVDLLILSTLFVLSGGARGGLAILLLFPLAGGAILAPLVLALFFTSLVSLLLLLDSVWQSLRLAADVSISAAGLYGMAFFAAVVLLNRLASKLLKQEALAEQRGNALQLQEAINRLVIADMGDGILVVDSDTTIVTGNPAAELMLGLTLGADGPGYRLSGTTALVPIAEAFLAWAARPVARARGDDADAGYVMLKPGDETPSAGGGRRDLGAHLKLRFANVEAAGLQQDRTVIFLQDVSEIENRAQELKLASMGRLTASIAHEVRNPLSAIAYASSLLEEESPSPTQTRLLRIVDDNVGRLNRMIEDILKLSRKAQPLGEPLQLELFCADILPEFITMNALSELLIEFSGAGSHRVHFDPLHLREVLMNLLSNAVRYASGGAGSIRVEVIASAPNRIELHVRDDGVPITPAVRAHLFEPFYTTSSKGTGLGLYLARELCLNNQAMLDYECRIDADAAGDANHVTESSGRFVIVFATAQLL
ncbi:two-component system sensor histidine kinase NtrB [Actimicrobium antarcticum]|uniref:histidine kinase n=1 Tax=Actimicrobium antarcticum TaxID=1051899 RepID=A0ABP7TCT8_9BURK